EERVARALAPLFVLRHRLARPGDALDRAVRVLARLDGGDRRQRAEDEKRRGHGTDEAEPFAGRQQRDHSGQHAQHQEGDDEVNDLRVIDADVGHWGGPFALVAAEVAELQLDAEILRLEQGDRGLQLVLAGRGDAYRIALDGGLHLLHLG